MNEFTPNTEGIFFSLPAEAYHAAPGCSHTMLKHMDPPARLPEYMATRDEEEPTGEMVLGTLTHNRILTPDIPLPTIAIKPKGMKFSTTDGKLWRDSHAGKLIVKEEDWDALNGMVEAVAKDPICKEIFAEGWSEVSVFKNSIESPTVLRKCRLDWVPKHGTALVDIKTCQNASREAFRRTDLRDKGYYCQAAYYLNLWNDAVFGTEFTPRKHFVFIAVEKKPPYLVAIHPVGPFSLGRGFKRNSERLNSYGECVKSGRWPGFTNDMEALEIPEADYATRKDDSWLKEAV